MPTIAGEPHRPPPESTSFGVDAERYERARPRYPGALIERIAARSPGPGVLDVGMGTGIAARQLAAAGLTVFGVEPDARMAAVAARHGIGADIETFEAWDPAGRVFDAVIAAQAWHWIDPVAGAAKAASALRPGGLFTPFWNAAVPPAELTAAFAEALHRAFPDSPFDMRAGAGKEIETYRSMCARAAEGIASSGAFGEPEEWRFDWERRYTRDAWLDQLPTTGGLVRMPPDAVAGVLDEVGAAVDALGGAFTMRYATLAVAAVRVAVR
ncbi:MAG TPA: methyltransferase domain-containing protein [Phytomonospora sp.]